MDDNCTTETAEPLFSVHSLNKSYNGERVLADVEFSIRPGEILGLIGPNGAGKTTLLETAAGILPADSGIVRWRAQNLPLSERRKVLFYIPDGVRPYGEQYTGDVLSFFAHVYGVASQQLATTTAALNLGAALNKRIASLSKGYNRRLMVAIGLLVPHQLLMMDEPFDGFDIRQTREMSGLLRAEARSRSLLLAIHQLSDAERICDRFMLLAGGQIRGVGTIQELQMRTRLKNASLEEIFLALS